MNEQRLDLPTPDGSIAYLTRMRLPLKLEIDNRGDLFNELWKLHPKDPTMLKIMGRMIPTPRYSANYGCDYYYTGVLHKA